MSFSPLIPPALASRARRQRSNAISRARESEAEWDTTEHVPDSPSPTSSSNTSTSTSPWRDDELICPLALDTAQHTHAHANAKPPSWIPVPVWPSNEGELQAVLAQFTFPASASGRKHGRSGEMIAYDSPTSTTPPSASAVKRGGTSASGPTRRALCSHCERGRNSA